MIATQKHSIARPGKIADDDSTLAQIHPLPYIAGAPAYAAR
ncbi:hypothetical protein [Breoghania sp.]|nr:hypothetical protein [Breoghania sp.]